jgi:hypothetical protein
MNINNLGIRDWEDVIVLREKQLGRIYIQGITKSNIVVANKNMHLVVPHWLEEVFLASHKGEVVNVLSSIKQITQMENCIYLVFL